MDTWTISELAERAAAVLADLEVNGRVQDVPNERLIRWYATLGLLDPPIRKGRTARYTGRHLLQLVAIKRRQSAGRTLAEIQAELTGSPSEALLAITGPLPGLPAPAPVASPAPARHRFWAAAPGDASAASVPPGSFASGTHLEAPAASAGAPPSPANHSVTSGPGETERAARTGTARRSGTDGISDTDVAAGAADETGSARVNSGVVEAGHAVGVTDVGGAGEGSRTAGAGGAGGAGEAAVPDVRWAAEVKVSGKAETGRVRSVAMQGVLLAPGVTLLLETAALDEEDLAALRAAAEPLLEELAERRLLMRAAAGREDEPHL